MSQTRTAGGVAARFGRQHVLNAMKIFLTANLVSAPAGQVVAALATALAGLCDVDGDVGRRGVAGQTV